MGMILKQVIAKYTFWSNKPKYRFNKELKLVLKAEMQKGVYLLKNGRVIRSQNEKEPLKYFKHVKYAGNYFNYKNIRYLTTSTNLINTVFPLISTRLQISATL